MVDWNKVIHEFLAELIGTFILLFVGFSGLFLLFIYPTEAVLAYDDCGRNKSCNVSGRGLAAGKVALHIEMGNVYILVLSISFGSALLGAILMTGHISGAHFNPSVTITLAALSKMPWNKVIYYLPAQYLGAFLSAAAIHVFHLPHMTSNGVDNTNKLLDLLFVTSPHSKIDLWTAMLDGLLSGFVFNLFIMAIVDVNGYGIPPGIQPIYVFLCFIGILISFSINCGAALNPARDLGPKLYVALFRGFDDVFDDLSYCFWWLPQQICITLGYFLGGLTYYVVFERFEVPG